MSSASSLSESMFISRYFHSEDLDIDSDHVNIHMPTEDEEFYNSPEDNNTSPGLFPPETYQTSVTLTDGERHTSRIMLSTSNILDEKTLRKIEYLQVESKRTVDNIFPVAHLSPPETPIGNEEDITELDLLEVRNPFTVSPICHESSPFPSLMDSSDIYLKEEEGSCESDDERVIDGNMKTISIMENISKLKNQMITDLKTESEVKDIKIDRLEEEKKGLSEMVDKARDKVEDISRTLREKCDENERLEREREEAAGIGIRLETENRELEEKNRKLEVEMEHLVHQIHSERKLRMEGKKNLEEMEGEKRKLEGEIRELRRELDKKLEEGRLHIEEEKKLRLDLEKVRSQIEEERRSRADLEEERRKLHKDVEERERKLQEEKKRNTELEGLLRDLERYSGNERKHKRDLEIHDCERVTVKAAKESTISPDIQGGFQNSSNTSLPVQKPSFTPGVSSYSLPLISSLPIAPTGVRPIPQDHYNYLGRFMDSSYIPGRR